MIKYLENLLEKEECDDIVSKCINYHCVNHITNSDSKANQTLDDSDYYDLLANSVGFGVNRVNEAYSLLERFQPKLEELIGKDLEPINVFFRQYDNGGKLGKHKDRDDIFVTLSITLENDSNTEWSLCGTDYDGTTICKNVKVGDGLLIYDSHELEHWRDGVVQFQSNDDCIVCLFLHWAIKGSERGLEGRKFMQNI